MVLRQCILITLVMVNMVNISFTSAFYHCHCEHVADIGDPMTFLIASSSGQMSVSPIDISAVNEHLLMTFLSTSAVRTLCLVLLIS